MSGYFKILSIVFVLLLLVLGGCANIMEEHRGAAVGAGAGAATGGIIGAVAGRSVAGVVVGSLIGGLVGGVVGHYAYDQPREREETARIYNYSPARGPVLRIEDAVPSPRVVRPGDLVDLR